MHASPAPITLAAYGAVAFPLAAGFIALQVIIPAFYASYLGLSLSAVGAILLSARLWDMITDPLVGYLSDHTPWGLGRRKTWVVVGSLPLAVALWFLFNPPQTVDNFYLLVGAFAIYAAGTLCIVPLTAWGAELSRDYHQRSRIAGSRVTFGLFGTLTALLLIDNSTQSHIADSLYRISLLVIVSLLVVVPLAACLVPDKSQQPIAGNNLKGAWSLLVKPSPFRRLLAAFLFNGFANAIPAGLFLFYVSHVLQRADLAGTFLFLYFLCSAAAIPFWVALSRRLNKHRSWCLAVLGSCVFFAAAPFLGAGDTVAYAIIVVGTGLMIGADLCLPSAINSDLIEWDAKDNNAHRPGLFFALWGTTSKLGFALAVGFSFPLLEWMNFDATAENSPGAITALALLYGVPSIVLKLSAVAMMYRFPIDATEHRRILQQLQLEETA